MGRIIANIKIKNLFDEEKTLDLNALVDTGAAYLTLPAIWKPKLGNLKTIRIVDCELATQQSIKGEICGPVEVMIEGFEPVYSEVLFLDMLPTEGSYVPLLGYIILEQAQAAVDLLGHRLVKVKRTDLK